MICNVADLNVAIDWLERENIPSSASWVGAPVLFRGWPLQPVRLSADSPLICPPSRIISFYRLCWHDDCSQDRFLSIAPWVIDELAKLATVAE